MIYTFGKYTVEIDDTSIRIQPGDYSITTTAIRNKPKFFQQQSMEWVYFHTGYSTQHFINLVTGASYTTGTPGGFCWADTAVSPDGMTIAVNGCYWACNYEIKFFDLSQLESEIPELPQLESGMPELSIVDPDPDFYMSVGYALEEYQWLMESAPSENVFEFIMQDAWSSKYNKFLCYLTEDENDDESEEVKFIFRIQLRREGDQMVYVLKESTPGHDLTLAENKIQQAKLDTFNRNFPSNLRYQQLKAAFPQAQTFLFYHNGAHEDVDSDIQDVHFGAWLQGIGKLNIKSFKDKTLVEEIEFPTMEAALEHASKMM